VNEIKGAYPFIILFCVLSPEKAGFKPEPLNPKKRGNLSFEELPHIDQ
jgi:hypothetical protein